MQLLIEVIYKLLWIKFSLIEVIDYKLMTSGSHFQDPIYSIEDHKKMCIVSRPEVTGTNPIFNMLELLVHPGLTDTPDPDWYGSLSLLVLDVSPLASLGCCFLLLFCFVSFGFFFCFKESREFGLMIPTGTRQNCTDVMTL